jgi:hypothetical protein
MRYLSRADLCYSMLKGEPAALLKLLGLPQIVAEVVGELDTDALAARSGGARARAVSRASSKRQREQARGQRSIAPFPLPACVSATEGEQPERATHLTFLISSVPISSVPMPTGACLPSAKMATGVPFSSASAAGGSEPPGEVRPGHIMLAPCRARESGGQYTEPCWIGAKSRARTSCEEEKAETHSKQETDRAPVDLDVRQEVRVPLEQAERREVGLVKVLEEQGLAVEGVDRTPVVAVSAV